MGNNYYDFYTCAMNSDAACFNDNSEASMFAKKHWRIILYNVRR